MHREGTAEGTACARLRTASGTNDGEEEGKEGAPCNLTWPYSALQHHMVGGPEGKAEEGKQEEGKEGNSQDRIHKEQPRELQQGYKVPAPAPQGYKVPPRPCLKGFLYYPRGSMA